MPNSEYYMSIFFAFIWIALTMMLCDVANAQCFSGTSTKEVGVIDYSGSTSSSTTRIIKFPMKWERASGYYNIEGRITSGNSTNYFWLDGFQISHQSVGSVYKTTGTYALVKNEEYEFEFNYNAQTALNENFTADIRVMGALTGQYVCNKTFQAYLRKDKVANFKRIDSNGFIAAGVGTSGKGFVIRRALNNQLERVHFNLNRSFDQHGDLVAHSDKFYLRSDGEPFELDLSTVQASRISYDSISRMDGTGNSNPLVTQYGIYKGIVWDNNGTLTNGRIGGTCAFPGSDVAHDNDTGAFWSVKFKLHFIPNSHCTGVGSSFGDLVKSKWNGSSWTDQTIDNWVGFTSQIIVTEDENVAGTTSNGRLYGTYKTGPSSYAVHRFDGLVKSRSAAYNPEDGGLHAITPSGSIVRHKFENGSMVKTDIDSWMGPVAKIIPTYVAPNPLYGVTTSGKLFIIWKEGNNYAQADLNVQSSTKIDVGQDIDDSIAGVAVDGRFYIGKWANPQDGFQFEFIDIY